MLKELTQAHFCFIYRHLQGYHMGTRELEEMGRFFCAGILRIGSPYVKQNSANQLSQSSDTNSDSRINMTSENW